MAVEGMGKDEGGMRKESRRRLMWMEDGGKWKKLGGGRERDPGRSVTFFSHSLGFDLRSWAGVTKLAL